MAEPEGEAGAAVRGLEIQSRSLWLASGYGPVLRLVQWLEPLPADEAAGDRRASA